MFEVPERFNVGTLIDRNLEAGRGDKAAVLERHGQLFTDLPEPPLLVSANGPFEGARELDELLESHGGEVAPVDTHRDDPAFWLFSGGSTGPAKAVVPAHRGLP